MILVGTSGWQYADWRGPFYPPDLPQRSWLRRYAEAFATVEVNSAFYRLPERATFAEWAAHTPADFVLAVKMSRYLTHVRRLHNATEPVARFVDRASGLGAKLGPVLLQLPPTLRVDPGRLDRVLAALGRRARVAFEPRHASWWHEEVRDVLTSHGAALCWADRDGRPVGPLWRTADFGYLRLHGGTATPRPRYGARALRSWVERVAAISGDVFVYFNNDTGAAAVADAGALADIARHQGLLVTRVLVGHDGQRGTGEH